MKARERENLKDTAKIYERMDAEEAAEILSKMYEKKPETVVKLISLMRDRSAGEIMAEFSEPDTCGEITEKLSHVEEPAQKEG
jgi:flagellar motility protein MotE (MotC chaperone)